MENILTQNQNVYQKQHSFDSFRSNISASCEDQAKRVVQCLKQVSGQKDKDIFDNVIADLTADKSEEVSFRITTYIADELSKIDDDQLSRYIFHRYRYDVYPKTKKLDDYPPYLQIEPSSVCNFRCVFCYQTDREFTKKNSGQMGTMSLGLFKDIVDEIEGHVDFISLASRGEPFVCKEINQMLKYCVGKFLGLKVNTNASLLCEEHCHAMLAGGVNTVVFSADAAEEPLYSQLRVGGKLKKVLKNIEMFRRIREKHYPRSKVITRVSGVKYGKNQDMEAMVKTWGDLVDQVAFVQYNPWENVYESPCNSVKQPCSDLWRRMFVWYDGKVNPCDTDFKSTLSVGSIQQGGLSQLWLSDQYQQLRKQHLENQRSHLKPCQRCTVV